MSKRRLRCTQLTNARTGLPEWHYVRPGKQPEDDRHLAVWTEQPSTEPAVITFSAPYGLTADWREQIEPESSRRRREVQLTDVLRRQVEETVETIRAMFASGKLPPAVNDARCKECSLKELCQPQAMTAITKLHEMRNTLFQTDEQEGS